jgi:cyclohexyl-isocyanide hydratase
VVLAKLRGDDAAKLTQLAMEYDPEPPFNSGSAKTVDPAIVQRALSTMATYMERLASNSSAASRAE